MSGPVMPAAGPPDVIEIRGIRGFGRHGVFDHERAEGQEFVVDVRLELDTRKAAATDDLADTVNYGVVAEQVHAAIEVWHPDGTSRRSARMTSPTRGPAVRRGSSGNRARRRSRGCSGRAPRSPGAGCPRS